MAPNHQPLRNPTFQFKFYSRRFKAAGLDRNLQQSSSREGNNMDDLSFSIVLQPKHLSGGDFRVAIPHSFANKYLTEWQGKITLHSEDGQTWPCNYISVNIRKRKVVSVCWRKFAEEYPLEVGDVCEFELIDRAAMLLNVSIFRKP